MLRPGSWAAAALGTALAVAGGPARAADPPAPAAAAAPAPAPAEKPGFFGRLFGKSPPKAKPAPAAAEPPPNPGAIAAEQREEEQAALLRRQLVCDRIREIARELGDEKLLQQADTLERRAEQAYQQRTSHLPSSRVKPDEGEAALDAQLGTASATAAGRLAPPQAPAGPASASAAPKGVRP